MSQEVIALKLSSGEEIVARVEERDDDSLTLDRAMLVGIVPSPNNPNEATVRTVPWLTANQEATVKVYNAHVVAAFAPHPELEKSYLKDTTNIQIA